MRKIKKVKAFPNFMMLADLVSELNTFYARDGVDIEIINEYYMGSMIFMTYYEIPKEPTSK